MRTLEFLLRRSYLKGDGDPGWMNWLFEYVSLCCLYHARGSGAQHLRAGSMAAHLTPKPRPSGAIIGDVDGTTAVPCLLAVRVGKCCIGT